MQSGNAAGKETPGGVLSVYLPRLRAGAGCGIIGAAKIRKGSADMETILLHGLGQAPDSFSITSLWLKGAHIPSLRALMAGKADYPSLYQGFAHYCGGVAGPLGIAGVSLGGVLALDYALQNPGKVGALALIATPSQMPKKLLAVQDILFRLMPERMFAKSGFSKSETRALARSMRELDFSGRLGELKMPVLLVCGGKDEGNLKQMREMQKHIAADLVILEHAGHEVNLDEPERLGGLLRDFFGKA